jgi:hypothetical protein
MPATQFQHEFPVDIAMSGSTQWIAQHPFTFCTAVSKEVFSIEGWLLTDDQGDMEDLIADIKEKCCFNITPATLIIGDVTAADCLCTSFQILDSYHDGVIIDDDGCNSGYMTRFTAVFFRDVEE